ncbi:MAG: FtsW/RodA/SpoVE family cell cycle protein [Armatimonadetes bacterium]|nr:FtsW/RodA/SpoVE family cell cycle protein [Armatimonadota bacterium]
MACGWFSVAPGVPALANSRSARAEITGLALAGIICGLAMAHVCLVKGLSLAHASRAFAPAAALLLVALLLDQLSDRRDRTLLMPVALLCGLSIVLLWRLDGFLAAKQVVWIGVGCLMLVATYLLIDDVENLRASSPLAGMAAALLLVVTMVWGEERNGARLWLGVPGLAVFQPGELAKILLVMFLAGLLADYRERPARARGACPLLVVLALGVSLTLAVLVAQRDLGAAGLLAGVVLVMVYFVTDSRWAVAAAGAVLVLVVVLATQPNMLDKLPGGSVLQRRLVAWVDPWTDPQDAGWQTIQGLICLAHGGVLGAGSGLGAVADLPVAESDMIYAVAAEDLGFAGAAAILLLYALIAWRGFQLALAARGTYSLLLAAGLSTLLSLQTLLIVAGVLRILPLTGVTMPFLSYGGSSMVGNFILVGLLLCVSREVRWESARRGRSVG